MKKQERPILLFYHQAKIGDNQTTPEGGRRQLLRMAACNATQTRSRRPFAHRVSSFWRDVGILFS